MSVDQPQFQPAPAPTWWSAAPPHVPVPAAAPGPPPEPRGRSGLAVLAVVLAATALAGVLATAVWLAATGGAGTADAGWGPITGQVAVRGGALSGDDLAAAVRQRIRDDGGNPSRMSCPGTPAVAQNVTTVCHGVVDDSDWAMVVFFEDTSGNYTLLPV